MLRPLMNNVHLVEIWLNGSVLKCELYRVGDATRHILRCERLYLLGSRACPTHLKHLNLTSYSPSSVLLLLTSISSPSHLNQLLNLAEILTKMCRFVDASIWTDKKVIYVVYCCGIIVIFFYPYTHTFYTHTFVGTFGWSVCGMVGACCLFVVGCRRFLSWTVRSDFWL